MFLDFRFIYEENFHRISVPQWCIPELNQAYQHLENAKLSYASASKLTSQLAAFSASCFSRLENFQLSDFIQQAITSD